MKHNFILLFLLIPLVGNAQSNSIETRLGYLPQWQFHNELEMQNWPKLLAGEEIDPETLFLMKTENGDIILWNIFNTDSLSHYKAENSDEIILI